MHRNRITQRHHGDGHSHHHRRKAPGHHPARRQRTGPVTNTFQSALVALTVTKTIDGPAAGQQGQIVISTRCGDQTLTDFIIPAGAAAGTRSKTYTGLTPGATCTVHETVDGSTDDIEVLAVGDGQEVIAPVIGTDTAHLRNSRPGCPPTARTARHRGLCAPRLLTKLGAGLTSLGALLLFLSWAPGDARAPSSSPEPRLRGQPCGLDCEGDATEERRAGRSSTVQPVRLQQAARHRVTQRSPSAVNLSRRERVGRADPPGLPEAR